MRNAKRAAETANAHKTDFLARVSHEIRTPLNAIIGFADMMATERFGPIGHPRYIEYSNDIVRSGRHVLDIVNDLLDISKIEAGQMDVDFKAVALNETIAEAVSLVQPQANNQRVIIRTALSQSVRRSLRICARSSRSCSTSCRMPSNSRRRAARSSCQRPMRRMAASC